MTTMVLAKHLGEYVSRECAREGKTQIVVLRLGKVVRADEVKDQPPDPLWVDERDVVHAVSCALTARLNIWVGLNPRAKKKALPGAAPPIISHESFCPSVYLRSVASSRPIVGPSLP